MFQVCQSVSRLPFFDLKGSYHIRFKDDKKTLDITITLVKPECGDEPVFCARLKGQGRPLTTNTFYRTLLKYPFNALLNMPRILRQALTLCVRKKLPVFPKPVPQSEYTMRKQAPSWLARRGMKFCFSFFQKQSSGSITVALPEGERQIFGPERGLPAANLEIKDHRFFSLIAKAGEVGLGMAYEKGYWRSENLVNFMSFMLDATLSHPVKTPWCSVLMKILYRAWHFQNRNTLAQAQRNISKHYDLSNAMYSLFLDETLTYSCALFDHEDEPLEEAQMRKIDLILEKACLSGHHHVLEIGTGWGTLAMRAAQRYGCRVTSITLSKEQQELAQERIAQAGLSDRIDVILCDYRHVTGQYDRIISVEMLEAVGKAYYPDFFRRCDGLLKKNGMLILQTITIPDQRYESYAKTTDWMRLFIFPGGLLPSLTAITKTLTKHTSLVIKDVESIGPHYALTLAKWRQRFLANRNQILQLGFSESFIRRWEYYFSYCQAGFSQHYIDDLQIVITRPRNPDCIDIFERKIERGNSQKDSVR